MAKKRFGPEQVVAKLRQIDVLTSAGKALLLACQEAGITDVSYYVPKLYKRIGKSIRAWPHGAARFAHAPAPLPPCDRQCRLCHLASRYW